MRGYACLNNTRLKVYFFLLGLPALSGFAVLYLLPFCRTVWYSLIDNTYQANFVFLDNYINVLKNPYYQLAMKNTLIFSAVGVVSIGILSVMLSFGLLRLGKRLAFVKNLLIAPMVMPTAGIVFVWQIAFQNDWYRILTHSNNGEGLWTIFPIMLLYIWKNTGINIIILGAALIGIQEEVLEAATLDGADGFRLHRSVTLPLISPSLTFVIVLSFVNALKNFRESYLFFQTDYPPDAAYTVQYYMNNHFRKLNYQNLTAGSVMFTIVIVAILMAAYFREKRYNDKIY